MYITHYIVYIVWNTTQCLTSQWSSGYTHKRFSSYEMQYNTSGSSVVEGMCITLCSAAYVRWLLVRLWQYSTVQHSTVQTCTVQDCRQPAKQQLVKCLPVINLMADLALAKDCSLRRVQLTPPLGKNLPFSTNKLKLL